MTRAAVLLGYRSRPSLMEVAAYLLYFPPVLVLMRYTPGGKGASGRMQTR